MMPDRPDLEAWHEVRDFVLEDEYVEARDVFTERRHLVRTLPTAAEAYEVARRCAPSVVECAGDGWAVYELTG